MGILRNLSPQQKFLVFSAITLQILSLSIFVNSAAVWHAARVLLLIAVAVQIWILCKNVSYIWKLKSKTVRYRLSKIAIFSITHLVLVTVAVVVFAIVTVKVAQQAMMPKSGKTFIPVAQDGFVDYRGQIHVHSYLSHDAPASSTFEKIAKAAKFAGNSWIILTDHIDELPPGYYPDEVDGVIFIYGNEKSWKKEKSSIFRASLKDPHPTLSLHGHIEDFGWSGNPDWRSWDALELVNFHANSFKKPWEILWRVIFNPEGIYQVLTSVLPQNLKYWQGLAEREGRPIPIFAAPDAHQNIGILGTQVDPYNLMLSLVSTHVWIEEKKPLNQSSIFDAIKKGRTYIAFDYLGDTTGFQFWAENQKGEKFFTGDTVERPSGIKISFPNSLMIVKDLYNVRGIEVKFYCNNNLIDGDKIYERMNPEPGFWRVEIWRDGYPWIISGQIMVK